MRAQYILLFGGESNERLVSFASGQHLAQNLKDARLWYWHIDSKIYEISHQELSAHQNAFTQSFTPTNEPIFANIVQAIAHPSTSECIFVLGLHGGAGENGELQAMFEHYKRHFTGSNAASAQLSFNKIAAKEALAQHNIKMAPHTILKDTNIADAEAILTGFFNQHGSFILKPICGGSSLGNVFINQKEQIHDACHQLFSQKTEIYMAEKTITGCELTVGVIRRAGQFLALPPTEIVVQKDREFDYEGKYLGLGTQEITPARISAQETLLAQQTALAAHQALGLGGYSRSDMIMASDGMYFLETNSLPGLTKKSLLPQQLACANLTMGDFLQEQIALAASATA